MQSVHIIIKFTNIKNLKNWVNATSNQTIHQFQLQKGVSLKLFNQKIERMNLF